MSEERQRILHLLSIGKLTVDEAEKLLTAFENTSKPAAPVSDVRGKYL